MVRTENPNWQKMNHSVFAMRFAALLEVSDFSGFELDPHQQRILADSLVTRDGSPIEQAAVEVDPSTGYTTVASIVEADDEADALSILAFGAVSGLSARLKADPECLQLVEAHVAYEGDIEAAKPQLDPLDAIADRDYCVEEIKTFDIADGQQPIIEAAQIFYEARDEVIERL